jgi:hypothetical protein
MICANTGFDYQIFNAVSLASETNSWGVACTAPNDPINRRSA